MEKNSLRYLWSYVRIFKYFFLLIIFLTLLSQICGQFYPYFLAKIYDTAAKASQDADVWERIFAYAFWALALGLGEVLLFEATMFIDVRFFRRRAQLLFAMRLIMLIGIRFLISTTKCPEIFPTRFRSLITACWSFSIFFKT